ncbi:MAG: Thiamine-monophosphate kinase [Syntrophorhabdus sp. PtaB.Bin047]|nr:MAG: Thiamine-monophosphate kinase [Syntrophorhabdus sp. PtaB.Bin047]
MEISENSFIKGIRKFSRKSNTVIRGIGDDGAVAELRAGQYVFVQDAMAEHVHFELSFMDPYYVGKKALYSNISDVLAMGAQPVFYLVTVGIPGKLSSGDMERMYRGMDRAAREFGVTLLGGDTVATAKDLFIDISVIGKLASERYFGRDKARKGDLIAVTGKLGEAALGLRVLKEGGDARGMKNCIRRFLSPAPPYALWKEIVKDDITDVMMDVSDGLILDLSRMMDESRKQARIHWEKVPMPRPLMQRGLEELAFGGGEDYQLLFTFPREKLPVVAAMIKKGRAVTIIGEVVSGRGVRVYRHGSEITGPKGGYDHFGGRF